jgi:inorganic pyrophosphatase
VIRSVFVAVVLIWTTAGGGSQDSPRELPSRATTALAASLKAAAAHRQHVWRDTVPINADGTVNAYIEIARGDRRKFEFDMGTNALKLDRMIPEAIGGYPVNYGYVPQTVSYDGDPFDALVLGPAIKEGQLVRGVIVGVMFMEDEKGLDSKVVLSRTNADGKPVHQLSAADQQEIGDFFKRYKENQPGLFSKVPGWGSIEQGLQYVTNTHAFFKNCRARAGATCQA